MSEEEQDISLSIKGMTCTNCAQLIVGAIEQTGATDVDVNFITAEAHITLPSGKVIEDVVKAVAKAGYKAFPLTDDLTDLEDQTRSHASSIEKRFYFSICRYFFSLIYQQYITLGYLIIANFFYILFISVIQHAHGRERLNFA